MFNRLTVDHALTELMADTVITAVVFDRRQNQLRQAITGGKVCYVFNYPSMRYGRSQKGEGRTELSINEHHEVVCDTLDFMPQPCRIEALVRGRRAVAFPDHAVVRAGGRPTLGESKPDWEGFERGPALQQQAITRKGADALGWDYEQITPAALGTVAFRDNVHHVQLHRFLHVPTRHRSAVVDALSDGRARTVGRLCDLMGVSLPRGLAIVCALMVRRSLKIDLSSPLGERSPVLKAPDMPFTFPSIRL